MRNDNVKPQFRLVAIDETKSYDLPPGDSRWITQILQTYVYDQHEYTYLCELTPSHYLEPVYTSIVFAPDTPDDVREELQKLYECCAYEGTYLHVSYVRFYVEQHPNRHDVYGEAESMDEAREYYQGNWVL